MSVGPGTTLAHYRITAELGAGGMGEVWRATDEKLGREVALKVLPEEFAKDPERMARFEREGSGAATVEILGCTAGGHALFSDHIAAPGLFMEFADGLRTTRIRTVRRITAGEAVQ